MDVAAAVAAVILDEKFPSLNAVVVIAVGPGRSRPGESDGFEIALVDFTAAGCGAVEVMSHARQRTNAAHRPARRNKREYHTIQSLGYAL